jgi:predicted RNA binding protein YcfA (HicA-like mRNA interferase family)
VPVKIRHLIKNLTKAGFCSRSAKGSHCVYKHPSGVVVVISGTPGADALPYQVNQVRQAVERSRK